MSKDIVLPDEIVKIIQKIVNDIKKENSLPNIVKDEVFQVLENRCTVIYYPLMDEYNRGFHIKRLVGEKLEDFVYINTDKTIEQQIFTAAHELGHVYSVYDIVIGLAAIKDIELNRDNQEYEEKVTDRFAAEFVMPETEFILATEKCAEEYELKDSVLLLDMLKMIAKLMDEFMAPFDAVRKRLCEIHAIDKETDKKLSKNKDELAIYIEYLKKDKNLIINGNTGVRTISGLRSFLEKASNNPNTDKILIKKIRNDFKMEDIKLTEQIKFSGVHIG